MALISTIPSHGITALATTPSFDCTIKDSAKTKVTTQQNLRAFSILFLG